MVLIIPGIFILGPVFLVPKSSRDPVCRDCKLYYYQDEKRFVLWSAFAMWSFANNWKRNRMCVHYQL